jgi:homoaconitase/3-isopropylmalate dehydratase large subunit
MALRGYSLQLSSIFPQLEKRKGLVKVIPGWAYTQDRAGVFFIDGVDNYFSNRALKFPVDRSHIVLDHYAPPPDQLAASQHDRLREYARGRGVSLHDVGSGVSHNVMAGVLSNSSGSNVRIVVSTDSHVTQLASEGYLAVQISVLDYAQLMYEGHFWMPDSLIEKVSVVGELAEDVTVADALSPYIVRKVLEGKLVYLNVTALLSKTQVASLCNLVSDAGAKGVIYGPWEFPAAESVLEVNLTQAVRHVASAEGSKPVGEFADLPIDSIHLGSCSHGEAEDFRSFLLSLGKAGGVCDQPPRLMIVPGSQRAMQDLIADGWMAELMRLPNTCFITPGCGPCLNLHQGVLSSAERRFSTRGAPSRKEANVFVGSPVTAAYTYAKGHLS